MEPELKIPVPRGKCALQELEIRCCQLDFSSRTRVPTQRGFTNDTVCVPLTFFSDGFTVTKSGDGLLLPRTALCIPSRNPLVPVVLMTTNTQFANEPQWFIAQD